MQRSINESVFVVYLDLYSSTCDSSSRQKTEYTETNTKKET